MTDKISPYKVLDNWIKDGNPNSDVPDEVLKAKNIGQQYLLYYFIGSKESVYISNIFNNYSLFKLEREDIFKFIKEAVNMSGFRKNFFKTSRTTDDKLFKILAKKYPHLKNYDINLLIDEIKDSDDYLILCEMFGLKKPKVKKHKKSVKKEQNIKTLKDFKKCFNIMEV